MKSSTLPDVSRLSVADKMRLIEVLWADLEKMPESFESPAWHGEVLEERAAAYRAGKVKTYTLEEVKRELGKKRS